MAQEEKRTISVYSLMQAEKVEGKFKKEGAKVVRKEVKVYDDYAETVNENFKNSGKFYKLNKKANEAYMKAAEAKRNGKPVEETESDAGSEEAAE